VSFAAGDLFMGETLVKNMARTAGIDIFSVDYDLAPYARYPTTPLQMLGAWIYLTKELRYDPSQIYIGGDSYGAFATMVFNRYMRDVYPLLDVEKSGGKAPPTPGLVLISPWLHNTGENFASREANVKYDIITMAYANWGIDGLGVGPKYAKQVPIPPNNPWISPVEMSVEEMAELPPLFVTNGGIETLLDEGKLLVEKARKAGVSVEHLIEVSLHCCRFGSSIMLTNPSRSLQPGQTHDYGTSPAEVAVAKKAYRRMKTWFNNIEAKRTA
jgi:acetyl esterase/lipase